VRLLHGHRAFALCAALTVTVAACSRTLSPAPAHRAAVAPAIPDTLSRSGLGSLVGTIYRSSGPVTETSDDQGGWLLGSADQAPSFTYAMHRMRRGGRTYITLDSAAGHEGTQVLWRILDVVWEPQAPDSLVLSFACAYDDAPDRSLFGLAADAPARWLTHVLRAWRADTLLHRFTAIPLEGLRCENEGWGA